MLHPCVLLLYVKGFASKVGNFSKNNYIPKTNYWTYEEFEKFISVVDNEVYKTLYSTLYYTGMRLGECLALNWNDIKDSYIDINNCSFLFFKAVSISHFPFLSSSLLLGLCVS